MTALREVGRSRRRSGFEEKTIRRNEEENLHRAVIQHLRLRARPDVIFFHCPNGEARSKATGARLKAMGTLAGVPDLCFVLPDATVAFLELKKSGSKGVRAGQHSPAQIAFAERCEAIGVPVATAYNIDQALSVLVGWGILKEI